MNTKEIVNFEIKAWYRLAKVLYGGGWIVVITATAIAFMVFKPGTGVDLAKSYFVCPNETTPHNTYSLKDASGHYTKEDKSLNWEDHKMALQTCGLPLGNFNKEKARQDGMSEQEIDKYLDNAYRLSSSELSQISALESRRLNPHYQINFKSYASFNGWVLAISKTSAVFIIGIFLLRLLKSIFHYVLTGRRFSIW